MNILVTGGAGFIGNHLSRHLLMHFPVTRLKIVDNLSSGSLLSLDILQDDRVSFQEQDLGNLDALIDLMNGVDHVFHLAANPEISKGEVDPDLDFRQGTILTRNVLEAARINNVSKFLFTSGSGVYGDRNDFAFSESFGPCAPVSPYGAAKLCSEALISAYCHMFSMSGIVLRFANVVGPNQTHGVGYDFVNRLYVDRTQLRILGNGEQSKSYIHVDDILRALDTVLGVPSNSTLFEVYNVATQDYISVTEIAKIACKASGVDPASVKFVFTGGSKGWNGDVPIVRFDTGKIRSVGWKNTMSSVQAIESSLSSMWKRKLERENWVTGEVSGEDS
jgi:UDP-glucose 4-epimerase